MCKHERYAKSAETEVMQKNFFHRRRRTKDKTGNSATEHTKQQAKVNLAMEQHAMVMFEQSTVLKARLHSKLLLLKHVPNQGMGFLGFIHRTTGLVGCHPT